MRSPYQALLKIAYEMRKMPKLKRWLKRFLLALFWHIDLRPKLITVSSCSKIRKAHPGGSFFGYFDCCPENIDGLQLFNKFIEVGEQRGGVEIQIFDERLDQVLDTVTSNCSNFQQGCRAQWLDNNTFLFNFFCEKQQIYKAAKYNLSEKSICEEYDFPVETAYKDNFYLSISYERLDHFLPEYGYERKRYGKDYRLKSSARDGIKYVDLSTGQPRTLISLKQLLEMEEVCAAEPIQHCVLHCSISPDGKQFVFVHRSFTDGIRSDRLYRFSLSDESLICISEGPVISHYCWRNNETIICFGSVEGDRPRYMVIDVASGSKASLNIPLLNDLPDGHPTIFNATLVVDTYPDLWGYQRLIAFDLNELSHRTIGRFPHHPKFFSAKRCDLHPRFSRDGQTIFVDTVANGVRQFLALEIDGSIAKI